METKKGVTQTWWIIVAAVIAFVVVILILVWFKGGGEKLFGGIDTQIEGLKDKDNDGVANTFDKCPCDPKIGSNIPEGQVCQPIAGCIP